MTRWLVLALVLIGCKKTPSADPPTPATPANGDHTTAAAGSGSASPPPAAWALTSQPVQPMCGEQPLALPVPAAAPAPAKDRPLPRTPSIKACQDLASVAAACACLATSKEWTAELGLSPTLQCEPQAPATPDAQLVMVSSKPADEATTAGGEAFVFVARRGQRWSPVAIVEAAPDVDLSVTPKASHTAKVDRVEAHGSVTWIESHHEAQDKDMGESSRDGEAHGTVCVTGEAPWCGRLSLGTWTYAFTPATSACTTSKVATFAATVGARSVSLTLAHGPDDGGAAGHYTF